MALIHVTPGYQFRRDEEVTNAKLNVLGQPTAQFRYGGSRLQAVYSRLVTMPVALYTTVTTSDTEVFTVAYAGAVVDALWNISFVAALPANRSLRLKAYCAVAGTLSIQLRVEANVDLTAHADLALRVTMMQFSGVGTASVPMTPGKVFTDGEEVTRASLNLLGTPTATAQANLTSVLSQMIAIPLPTHSGTWSAGEEETYSFTFTGATTSAMWDIGTTSELSRFWQVWAYSTLADQLKITVRSRASHAEAEDSETVRVTMFKFE